MILILLTRESIQMIAEIEKLLAKLELEEVTIDDLVQWKNHPVTKRLCHDFIMAYSDNLEFLATNIPTNDETRAQHASIVGQMDIIKKFLDYVEDEKAELNDESN